jgi:hypothetical protein
MKLNFTYKKDEDVWCLLNKGKTSINSPESTWVYKELVAEVGENPDENSTSDFIDKYLERNNFNPVALAQRYQVAWGNVSAEFYSIAERIFGVSLSKDVTAYLTVNNRCPYNIAESLFFVSISEKVPTRTVMHELWHFYTWEKFGANEELRLGREKYNDLKEALTVLLNVECRHLLPPDELDRGYAKHQVLRTKILELWEQNQNLDHVWKKAQIIDL